MESKTSADHHEEDAGDDGVGDGVEEADHHEDGANTEHGPGEHGGEVSAFVDDDGNHVLQILSTIILSSSGGSILLFISGDGVHGDDGSIVLSFDGSGVGLNVGIYE